MKALITAQFDPSYLQRLSEQMEVSQTGWGVSGVALAPDDLVREMTGCDVLITEIEVCDDRVIQACPELRFIAVCRNNPLNVDARAARRRGIPVTYTPGRNAQAVAEFTLSLMLGAARDMGRVWRQVWSGGWTFGPVEAYRDYKGYELSGRSVGIIGLGYIGRKVLQLCQAFGMTAWVYDPYLQHPAESWPGVSFVALPELLREADFITVHCPDTPETYGLIGPAELGLMKPTAILINTARGKHVNEDALLDALRQRKIAGAALDVFSREPLPLDHPFYQLDNLIMTPHVAGATFDVITHQSEMVYTEIQRWLRGEPLVYAFVPRDE